MDNMDETLKQNIVTEITEHAALGEVLYLASGGSSISVTIAVVNALPPEVRARLTFTLTDERYGKVGHTDSNWRQLLAGGLDLSGITTLPVLSGAATSIEATATLFGDRLMKLFAKKPYVIALFGVGADSHIAGILPESPAAQEKERPVVAYHAGEYERLTITPQIFRHIDSAYVYARGEAKQQAVEGMSQELPIISFPNQLVKWCGHYFVSFKK